MPRDTNILRGEAYKNDISVPVSLFINYPESENDAIECDVLFDDYSQIQSVYNNNGFLQIRSTALWYLERSLLWIPYLSVYSGINLEAFRGIATLFFEGDLNKFNTDSGLADCYILIHENELYDEKHPISWKTPFGHAELKYDYPYDEPFHHIRNPNLKKLMIHIKLDFNLNKWDSKEKFLLEISAYLDNLMQLFSFLCKRYVWWYRLNLLYYPDDSKSNLIFVNGYRNPDVINKNSRKNKFVGVGGISSNMLVKKSPEGLISNVILQYFNSKDMDFIQRLISMIMITLTDSVIEQNLGIIYTALETLINEFTDEAIISDNKFKKLSRFLKECLQEEIKKENPKIQLIDNELTDILGKIPELRRKSFKDRLDSLFRERIKLLPFELGYGLNSEVLFDNLKQAISRRNKFIHRGDFDIAKALEDISLIRFFVSIWILDFLGYPLKEISSHELDLMNIKLYGG